MLDVTTYLYANTFPTPTRDISFSYLVLSYGHLSSFISESRYVTRWVGQIVSHPFSKFFLLLQKFLYFRLLCTMCSTSRNDNGATTLCCVLSVALLT